MDENVDGKDNGPTETPRDDDDEIVPADDFDNDDFSNNDDFDDDDIVNRMPTDEDLKEVL